MYCNQYIDGIEKNYVDYFNAIDISQNNCIGDGITDNTSAITSVYNNAISNGKTIYVPTGTYKISNWASFPFFSIFWGPGTIIDNNQQQLFVNKDNNGIDKALYVKRNTYGTYNNGAVMGVVANANRRLPIIGISTTNESALVSYPDRDSVSLYTENNGTTWVRCTNNVTYTTTTAVTTDDVSSIKIGMIIDTLHSPYKYSGIVRSIVGNTITVGSWYKIDGATFTPERPADGTGFVINPATKIWGLNLNTFLSSTCDTNASAGIELGMFCDKVGSTNWGVDVVNFSTTVKPKIGFQARRATNSSAKIEKGYLASDCETAYEVYSDAAGTIAFYTAYQQTEQNWMLLADGRMNKIRLMYANIGNGVGESTDHNNSMIIFTCTTDQAFTMYNSQGKEGYIYHLYNDGNNRVTLNCASVQKIHGKRADYSSIVLPPKSSLILSSKGDVNGWFIESSTFLADLQTGTASPSGVITPLYIGEEYFDSVGVKWYKSTGLTNTSWVALN